METDGGKATHMTGLSTHDKVKEYYGRVLTSKDDLRTNACCSTDHLPDHLRSITELIDDEIMSRFYGCGVPIPPAIEGCTVLDLGCGTGRDAYICSSLVGETGRVVGVDMTEEQLAVASRHIDRQTRRFGFAKPNVQFVKGYMEALGDAGVEDESIDVVISNCVINLSPEKDRVFGEALRVLKPGGEIYFSDVFADRRIPAELHDDHMLVGECLAGAMYVEDFRRTLLRLGVPDYRVVSSRRILPGDAEIEAKVGETRFFSLTVRAFKLASLEDRCEDYGQIAAYLGTIPGVPHAFELDRHHRFVANKPVPVCGNTAAMLSETRFAPHFRVTGDRSHHYGPFSCSSSENDGETNGMNASCC